MKDVYCSAIYTESNFRNYTVKSERYCKSVQKLEKMALLTMYILYFVKKEPGFWYNEGAVLNGVTSGLYKTYMLFS